MTEKKDYSMLQCVKCGFMHKVVDDYRCDMCNGKQFKIVKRNIKNDKT